MSLRNDWHFFNQINAQNCVMLSHLWKCIIFMLAIFDFYGTRVMILQVKNLWGILYDWKCTKRYICLFLHKYWIYIIWCFWNASITMYVILQSKRHRQTHSKIFVTWIWGYLTQNLAFLQKCLTLSFWW